MARVLVPLAQGCEELEAVTVIDLLRRAGIDVACIGQVLEKGQGIAALKKAQPTPWPQFEADEITQLF